MNAALLLAYALPSAGGSVVLPASYPPEATLD